VDSSEPSEVEEEAPISHQQPMACHPTKVVVHPEPANVGDAEEEMEPEGIQDAEVEMGPFKVQYAKEMPLPHMTGNVMEGTEPVSMQECVVWEAWRGWWESLKAAYWMQRVMVAALWDGSRGEPMVHVKKLMEEEEENFKIWRTCVLEEGDIFEENGIEVDAFGMCVWED